MARESKTSARRVVATERQMQAVKLRKDGYTYARIGEALGITSQSAHELVTSAMRRVRAHCDDDASELIRMELDRMDDMHAALWPDALLGDVKKIDRVLSIMARRAKLLGLDAPTKQHVTTSTLTPEMASKATDEQLSRIIAGEDPAHVLGD